MSATIPMDQFSTAEEHDRSTDPQVAISIVQHLAFITPRYE